jgi:hypothetical protein
MINAAQSPASLMAALPAQTRRTACGEGYPGTGFVRACCDDGHHRAQHAPRYLSLMPGK